MWRMLCKKFIAVECRGKVREGRKVGVAIEVDKGNVAEGSMDLLYIM